MNIRRSELAEVIRASEFNDDHIAKEFATELEKLGGDASQDELEKYDDMDDMFFGSGH